MQLSGNEEEFRKEIDFVKQCSKPLIGICFGCELLAVAQGGTLIQLATPHTGIRTVSVRRPELIGGKDTLAVYEHHEWIIDTLPPAFTIVAESDQGPEIIKHQSLPLYGLQFHPENLVEQTDGDEVFSLLFANAVRSA